MNQLEPRVMTVLARLMEPLGQAMTVEFARQLSNLKATPTVQERIDELADKCNRGELTDQERHEYADYVDAIGIISILQAQASSILDADSCP